MQSFYRMLSLGLVTVLAVACTSRPQPAGGDAPTAQLSGTVTYRERIALRPGSVVRVTLEDVSLADAPATVLAEQTLRPEGGVPIPFALEFDPKRLDSRHTYAVRAEIRDAEGSLRWISTTHHGVLTRGMPSEIEVMVEPVSRALKTGAGGSGARPRILVYECPDGPDFAVRVGAGEIELLLPDRHAVLPQTPAASGARYQLAELVYWSKEGGALLEVGDVSHTGCRSNPARAPWEDARLRGVAFRALGNEPSWSLEIHRESELVFVRDMGATELRSAFPPPKIDGRNGAREYRLEDEGRDLRVTIEPERCSDSMSGESFTHVVRIAHGGVEYRGCGRELALPFAGRWQLERMAGDPPWEGLAVGAVPALALDAWGSASGRSGCNRFMGRYLAGTRPSLSFGPLATTRMACPPASMNLESRFLGALAATQGYRVSEAVLRLEDETGKLLLELVPAPD